MDGEDGGEEIVNQAPGASLSGLEISVLVKELRSLKGTYLSNIYSENEAQLLQLKRPDEAEVTLVVSSANGAWLSDSTRANVHSETTAFTTALRTALYRMRVEDVRQYGLDRVVIFSFEARDRKRELVLELIPPGNILVLDESGRIVALLREFSSPKRRLARGEVYRPPPQNRVSPEAVDAGVVGQFLQEWKKVGEALGRGVSLPRKYVDEILFRVGLKQNTPTKAAEAKAGEIADALASLLREMKETPHPCLVKRENYTEILAVGPAYGEVIRSRETMSALADELFSPLLAQKVTAEHDSARDEKTKEYEATIADLERRRGQLLEEGRRARELASAIRGLTSEEEARAMLEEADLKLPDDLRRQLALGASPASVSSRLFDLAKARVTEVERVNEAAGDFRKRMERELKGMVKKRQAPRTRLSAKREWYDKFRWFYTSSGKLAVGGRDAQSNTLLVKRHVDESDVVYHADLFGSPFFVLKGGREQTEEDAREVAIATVCFSSGWKTGLGAADAYWVNNDQVSQSAPSGEYLARGSFLIKGKKNYVTKNILQIAVGVEEGGRVISGPESAVAKRSVGYVMLIPHREKSSETAKRVAVELRKMVEEGARPAITVDEVLRMLPAGGGKMIRKRQNGEAQGKESG